MYIIVVGGGKVGYYLTKTLVHEGYEVLLIEKDRGKVETYAERFGSVVMQGDGCEARTMEEAGTERADLVIAVTGDDEDNLVICQMAKQHFNVPKTISRVNNPKNETIFKKLGIDATISSTNVILSLIEEAIPSRSLIHLLNLRYAGLELIEASLDSDSPVVGAMVKDIDLPGESVISLIMRGDKVLIPTPSTTLQAGDDVVALAKIESERLLREKLLGRIE
jgi:trk system potassium uptake protein